MDDFSKKMIDENRDVYDGIADQFSSTRDYLWEDLKPFAAYVSDGDSILDAGCGNGRLYQLFSKNQVHYLGTDQSTGLLEEARGRFPGVPFELAPLESQPCTDDSIDTIFCIAAFHHLPDDQKRGEALREFARILKPGGRLVMSNWNLHNDWVREKIASNKFRVHLSDDRHIEVPWRTGDQKVWGWRHYWSFTPDELKILLSAHGFSLEECYYTADNTGKTDVHHGMNIVTIATYEPHLM